MTTPTLEQWKQLEALLANATGESEELDEACSNILGYRKVEFSPDTYAYKNGVTYGWFEGNRQIPDNLGEHPWSGSIDAALAFAEKAGLGPIHTLLRAVQQLAPAVASVNFIPITILLVVCAAKIKELDDGKA